MIKNTLKKSLALGLLMTFLITGSVWAEGTTTAKETTDGIFIGNTVGNPSSSESASAGKNIVAMGQNIEYTQDSKNIVSLGNNIESDGNRLVYIGSGINNDNDPDAIKQNIISYIKNIITGNESELNQFGNINLVAIGSGIDIQGKNSIAIGMGVTVEANNAVAIGAGSAATEDNTVSFGRGKTTIGNITIDAINRRLTHVDDGINATDAVNKGQLDAESYTRWQEDVKLQKQITAEASTRWDEDVKLQKQITAEASTRWDEDVKLQKQIDDEANTRWSEDVKLQKQIDDEANTRWQEDVKLQNQIDATNDRTGGITRNAEDTITTIEDNHQFYRDGNVSLNNGNFTLNSNGDTYTAGSATVQKDLDVHGDAYIGSGNNGQTVIRDNTSGYSEIIVNQNAINQVLINENGIKVGKNSSVMDTNGVYAGGDTFDQAKAAISATGELKGASGKFQVASDGNTTIAGTLDVTSTNGQLAVKDNYVATRVTRGTLSNATTAGSINTGNFIGERVKNSNGSEFTATGKNTDGIINVAYKNGDYTDVLQTSSGINVITKSANDNTFGSQTALGTEITGTDVSIEDPKNTANRIYLSDVGQVKNVDSELKANSNYIDSPTVVGAINAEADIRRAQFAKLGNKIEKVGAGAAALAAMHPLDFDPDDKLQFSAGVGNYGGETATALGAFYRPTEKVMFNIAGTMGNDENMMNAGITFALDGRNNVSNSRVAMAREIQDLRAQVAQLTNNQAQMMALLNKVLDGQADELLANVMFPDVPENHWAYEYLDNLQKRGIIKGYPDGSFGGDRSLTRYEYATMLCRVLDQGISVDTRLLDEFEAELGRIRIDRIKGKDDSANKIERVRVNSSSDRDDYGSQIINTSAPTTN